MKEKEAKQDPAPDDTTDKSKVGHTDHGIPDSITEEEPTGLPNSDRHHSEIAPAKD